MVVARRYANGSKVLIIKWQTRERGRGEAAKKDDDEGEKSERRAAAGAFRNVLSRETASPEDGERLCRSAATGQKYTLGSRLLLRVCTSHSRAERAIEMRGKYRAGRNVNFVAV